MLQWYTNETFKNCPILTGDGETESLGKITISGAFVIGEKDACTGGDAYKFASAINSYTKFPAKNKIIIIKDAGHVFYNKHNEYAQAVLDFIRQVNNN